MKYDDAIKAFQDTINHERKIWSEYGGTLMEAIQRDKKIERAEWAIRLLESKQMMLCK